MGGRARGSNSQARTAFEATPGTVVATGAGWYVTPFVSHSLGEERPLIASDLLGQGREMQDPTPDVATNVGDIVVPVDVRNFGRWLKLFYGAPTSAAGDNGEHVHTFTSGAAALPSMAIEIGSPEVPNYQTNYGARGNQLKIGMSRSGLLNATCSLIAIGETDPAIASAAGNAPTSLPVLRFPQATGGLMKDGAALGSVVAADITFSNQLDPVETIKADGRIEDSDPGQVMASGSVTVLYRDTNLIVAANNTTPFELDLGWAIGPHGLIFKQQRVFLPKAKKPVSGPKGIQIQYNWQASGSAGPTSVAVLTNDVAGYDA